MKPCKIIALTSATALLTALSTFAANKQELSLESYLQQVQETNPSLKASVQLSKAAGLLRDSTSLPLSPSLFAEYNKLDDKKEQANPAFSGTRTVGESYTVGLRQMTNFGLSGQFSYTLEHLDIRQATLLPTPNYYTASPKIELRQSLVKNGFGSETRAQLALQEAGATADIYAETFKALVQKVEAENAYWRLAIARKNVEVQRGILSRAERIQDWAEKRVANQLGDKADVLQARASLELRKLEMRQALEEERNAARAFNTARGLNGDQVQEIVSLPELETIMQIEAGPRVEKRLDVMAAEAGEVAAIKDAQLIKEKVKPSLDLFASYAYNGRDRNRSEARTEGWGSKNPTLVAGISFSTPLALGQIRDTLKGANLRQEAARLNFERKLLDQEQEWQELNRRVQDAKQRLQLSKTIENVQREKYENERQRLLRGRTTTYQTLLFEQELAQAEILRVRTQAEVLRLQAQMKLFRGNL